MFNLIIEYPTSNEETLIVKNINNIINANIKPIINKTQLHKFQELIV